MIEPDIVDWFRKWPRASFRQWLVGLGAFAALLAAVYALLSALGL